MRFAFDEDVEALRGEARRFLADERSWQEVAELGWAGLIVPEELGGAGLDWVALVGLLEETGRVLLTGPLVSTSLVQAALLAGEDGGAKERWLPPLAAGEATGAVAFGQGPVRRVTDGVGADVVVFEDAGDLWLIEAAGRPRRALATMDVTRPQAELRVERAGAIRLGSVGDLRELAAVAHAAEQAGGARACLEAAVDYAKVREQFGRPIGSFQAVQHMCADMMVHAESARSAAWYAGWVAAHRPQELPRAAAMARVTCTEAYLFNSGTNIQVHGGIGFSWEHDAHLHFKRARSTAAIQGLGDPQAWRTRYADTKGMA